MILESESILKTPWNNLKSPSCSYDSDVINDSYPKFYALEAMLQLAWDGLNFISPVYQTLKNSVLQKHLPLFFLHNQTQISWF